MLANLLIFAFCVVLVGAYMAVVIRTTGESEE
jgi:hypothetical protein